MLFTILVLYFSFACECRVLQTGEGKVRLNVDKREQEEERDPKKGIFEDVG